jgi:phosphomannomutase
MKFGTSGLRGLVDDMTDAACAAWVSAFLAHLSRRGAALPAALVGRDLRPSSPRIAAACLGAVRAAGVDAVDCGALPTPALALEAFARGAAAVMVTGSHIPADRNGLKFYRPDGEMTKADEAGVLAAMARPAPAAARPGGAFDGAAQARARWRARAAALAAPGALSGLRVGVWLHSAVGADWLAEALGALGADVAAFGRSAEFIPVDTEAVDAPTADFLAGQVRARGLDALVATDGDGDRPLLADETGALVRGDALGLLAARALGADAVATPVTASSALERTGWFGRIARTRIGSPFVIEGMARLAAAGARLPAGYEANGGFLLGAASRGPGGALDALPTRDALAPLAAVLARARSQGVTLSKLVATLPARATASDRLPGVDAAAAGRLLADLAADAGLRAAAAAAAGGGAPIGFDLLDGVRITLAGEDILHLRGSGNAPELRVYAEAAEPSRAAALVAAGMGWAAAALRVRGA